MATFIGRLYYMFIIFRETESKTIMGGAYFKA